MRLRTLGLAALLSTSLYQPTGAFIRPKGAEAPIVSADQGPRTHRQTSFLQAGTFAQAGLGSWSALWDHDTDVPLRMWGPGQIVSGSIADAAIAEAAARQFLAQHISTLAPGSASSDFELVTNQLDPSGTLRSVAFVQRSSGVRVLGGAVGFAFKADRLVMINSTALPHVAVQIPASRLAPAVVQRAATRWLDEAGKSVVARANPGAQAAERVIVPIVRPRLSTGKSIAYHIAEEVAVDATNNEVGSWKVWIDAGTGAPIARKSTISYASGRVLYDVPDRGPLATRTAQGAQFARYDVNATPTTSAIDGTITWAGTAPATVALKLTGGQFASVTNRAGAGLTETVTVQPNGTFTWSKATEEFSDAQLASYIHANIAKQFSKTRLNPTLGWLAQSIPVFVNENDTCNAFSNGDDIHFFRKSGQCENTGRLADVVYHEFGHSLHANSIIEGVGAFDGALSEGLADTIAMAITGDAGMGRGFFLNNQPLRNLDGTKHYPEDIDGEVHDDGELVGESMYDLRKNLEAKLGTDAGYEQFLKLMYSEFQRATDIPSTYAEALLADDDDGDLANGTPNTCEINAAFGKHGLADPALTLGIAIPTRDNFAISVQAMAPSTAVACPDTASITGATITWNLRGGAGGTVEMVKSGETFDGTIPTQSNGSVVQYKVTLTLSDASTISYPQNPADQNYEFFVGDVEPIKCFSFDSGGLDGWTVSSNQWEVGAPHGLSTDPKEAFAGTGVMGIDLSADGSYDPDSTQFAESPEIDLKGATKVRLQYRRWLGVEDGFYDQARILANGTEVWSNFKSATDPQTGGINHTDREWRFQDVDLAAQAATGKVKLRFELASDQGLEFGGWTMDDVCIVAFTGNGPGDDGDGDGGCCSTGGDSRAPIVLGLMTLGLVVLRRRRK